MRLASICIMIVAFLGCAKVNLATSQPLKVDINMRVDVYQHIVKDVASIEDQIFSPPKQQLNTLFFMQEAYAQESPELYQAIQSRRARASKIEEYFTQGLIGEDKNAYLVIRNKASQPHVSQDLVQENSDRKVIYDATAKKNNVPTGDVLKIFFDDHFKRAPSGYWFEVCENGACAWKQK